ncbi:ZP domain-containing protein-like [Discoglossus pictus]
MGGRNEEERSEPGNLADGGEKRKEEEGQSLVIQKASGARVCIVDFKVSGPANMTKRFTTSPAPSSRSMIVKWTPSTDDVGDHVPFCFVAETNSGYQSEMRCLIVIVGPRTLLNSTLTCTGNTMTLIIPKSPTSGLFENHLRLNDPQCLVTSNSTHFIASVGFNSCGTQIVETEDKIVFKNQITSFENMGDVITRKHQLGISFNCSFPKETRLSTGFRAERAIYQFTEAGFGNFTYRFQFFQDSQFNAVRTQYPLDVLLRDIIYMEVEVTSMTPNVQLFVESCKATPHDNPNDPVFYDIIKDGCPRDDTLVNYPGTNTMYRFAMEAFAFIGNYEEVYVSCTVILCKLGDPNTRCARGCVTSSQRRKRSLGSETQQHFISQGPLRLKREASSNRAPDPNLALNMNTLVVAVVVLAVVAIVALAWHSYRKRVKSTSYEKLPTEEL